jgi:hypothetical protein
MGNGAQFSLIRNQNVVNCYCFNRKITNQVDAFGTIFVIPTGYSPIINSPDEDSNLILALVNSTTKMFQIYANNVRPTEVLANETQIAFSVCWLTNDTMPA